MLQRYFFRYSQDVSDIEQRSVNVSFKNRVCISCNVHSLNYSFFIARPKW